MNADLHEWLNLLFRWFHVLAGVFWIGQTAFFSWLDARMRVEAHGSSETVWMVHSGGFYVVEKQRDPSLLPRTLHWFMWESAFTWLSGIFLLAIVYYLGGALLDGDAPVGPWGGAAIGAGTLVAGWLAYDAAWLSPLARAPRVLVGASLGALTVVAFALHQIFSDRAAYIHVGALLGTIMAANVWVRILPAQRNMLASIRAGTKANLALGERAKARSTHNTFMALPVIFIMISNHFPTASYGHSLNWVMLMFFVVVGFGARKLINSWNEKPGFRAGETPPAG